MKLKTLSRINTAVVFMIGIVMLPFAIVHTILHYIGKPFEYIYSDFLVHFRQRIGNKLLKMSDEVKTGEIHEHYYLKYGTARYCYKVMNEGK